MVDDGRDDDDGGDEPDDGADDAHRRLGGHGQAPGEAAGGGHHLAQRTSRPHRAEQPDERGNPAGAVGLGERSVDLDGDRPAEPGRIVDVISFDPPGEEPQRTDDEQRQWHEEQEQPERQRAADDRARSLPIALVDPETDIDQRTVVVLVDELVDPRLLVGEPGAAPVDQRPHPAPAQGGIRDRSDLADVDLVDVGLVDVDLVGRRGGRDIAASVAGADVAAAVSL